MCTEPAAGQPAVSRRQLLGMAGAGALAATFAVPGEAQAEPSPRSTRLHIVSDTHVSDVYPVTMQDMRETLTDLHQAAPKPDAMIVVGDFVEYGRARDYPLFDLALQTSPRPSRVLYAIGNHEYHANEDVEAMKARFLAYSGQRSVYYETEVNGYPLVFLGSEGIVPGETSPHAWTALLSTAQLDWFADTLARRARRDRPTLCFLHQPPENVDQITRLREILRGAPNVFLFWGHWHNDLNWFTRGPDPRMLGNAEGFWRIHTGATTYVNEWVHNPDGSSRAFFRADWKQALVVELSEGKVVIRGRDSYKREWVPGFQAAIPVT